MSPLGGEGLQESYRAVRETTVALCEPLCVEDMVVQSMPDASPTKWHLAHTTWFFETFVLRPAGRGYRSPDERYARLFNSYYQGVGASHPLPERGRLSRPTVEEILAYRRHVDQAMAALLEEEADDARRFLVELGLNHEEQHQELLLADVKSVLSWNPLEPAYVAARAVRAVEASRSGWIRFEGGLVTVGASGEGFAFDNERPRHEVRLEPFELASRPVTCGEYLRFIEDGGYAKPELWLSDGWDERARAGWEAPLYWARDTGAWRVATLSGARALDPAEPVCHVGYYEADAFARWAGARLPREEEWETAAAGLPLDGNLLEEGLFHPAPAREPRSGPRQMFGDVWEWTSSAYSAYPGFRPFEGTVGEYNGKFMSGRFVLRGGSCVTPRRHLRASYRNFFAPASRWQFSGIRLARDPGSH